MFPTSPSLSHSGPAQSRGPGPRYTTHALARADPRAALTPHQRDHVAQRKALNDAVRAAPRARAAAAHRRRSARPRGVVLPLAHADPARAREAVGRSFVRSFSRSSRSFVSFAVARSRGAAARAPLVPPRPCRRVRGGVDAQPPLDAAACASCAERGASLAPCFSARSHARGRDGSTAARRRVAAARRSSRRRSRALLAPARSAAAFATARHSAVAR